MKSRIAPALIVLCLAIPVPVLAQNASTTGTLDLYATFHAVGARLGYGGDVNGNATAFLEWRPQGAGVWTRGMFMTRITGSRWAGSVLWLQPNTPYEIRAVISDPDGGGSATGTLTTRQTPSGPSGATIWVDPNGNDADPGTSGLPLRTIQVAIDRANPGDQVRVRPGVYYQTVNTSKAGTPSALIHLLADGPGVVLDGSDLTYLLRSDWRDDGGGVYSLPFTAAARLISADSTMRLYHHASLAALQGNAFGISQGWVIAGGRLNVKLEGGLSPNGRPMHIARANEGVIIDQNYWHVAGFEVRYWGNAAFGAGILVDNSDGCWIADNYVHGISGRGIPLRNDCIDCLVEYNYVRDTRIGTWPWAACKAHEEEQQGISHRAGRGAVIRYNTVRGFFDGIDTADYTSNENNVSDCDIYENYVADVSDDAFEPEEVAGINLRIWRNRTENTFTGISIAPNRVGPQYVLFNTFHNYRSRGYKCSLSSTGQTWVMHNTFSTTYNAASIHPTGPYSNMHFRNNILTGREFASVSDDAGESQTGNDFDGDLCYSNTPTVFRWKNTNYATLAALRAATGFEQNGREGDPSFVSVTAGNLALLSGSPAIDGAIRYPGINDAFLGVAPDMGAWEFDPGVPFTPGSIAGRVTNGTTGAPIPGAQVNSETTTIATGADGAYRIDGLFPGNHLVTVNAPGYQASDSTVAVASETVTTLDFALEPEPPYIAGQVIDAATSQPIVGAVVSYSGGSSTTDNLGRYRLSDVAPGTYDVTASASGHISAVHQVVVGSIGSSTSDFALEPAPPQTRSLGAVADADVKSGATTNNGNAPTMRLRSGNPAYTSYLKFVVPGGHVETATLRLFCTDESDSMGSVFRVSNNWTETGITGANAPPMSGNPVARVGPGAVNTWIPYDVTAIVQGGDTVSVGLRSLATNSAYFSTREGANPPQLVLTYGAPVPPPTIVSFSPPTGPRGSVVTITGSRFSGVTDVRFAGTPSVFTIDNDTQIRATVPAGALSGPIALTNAGGTATSAAPFDVILAPIVRFFTPSRGPVGTSVDVHGNRFSSASDMTFNGTTVGSMQIVSDTLIQTKVPTGASSGPITVSNPGGSGASSQAFVVISPPAISFIAPTGGPVSIVVELHGSGLATTSAVTLNGAPVSFTIKSDTLVTATVPEGATSGPFGLTTEGGGATSAESFTVNLAPLVASFAPAVGPAGTTVEIHGRNFTGATDVAINGQSAGFTVDTDTLVRAIVAVGTTTGRIAVTNPDGTAVSATSFVVIVPPTIASFTPLSGPVGTVVTISGSGFTGVTAVAFAATPATQFTVDHDAQLRATVPNGATTSRVRVTNAAGTGESAVDFTVVTSSPPVTVSFVPAGDGYVDTSKPTTSYGTARDLKIRSTGPTNNSYLKFDITGLSGAVRSATLRLYCNNESVDGGRIYSVSNAYQGGSTPWVETGLNAGNAPAMIGTPLQQKGAVTVNTWVEFDVKAAIAGNGTYSFAIASGSTNIAGYDSRQGTNLPSLVIETGTPQPPAIVSLTPTSGPPGTAVDIRGARLSGATTVAFGVPSSNVTVVADTLVRAVVPAGATSGPVTLTNANGTATSPQSFTVTAAPPTSTWTFAPLADAHVNSGSTGNNYGSLSTLRARASDYRFFLKFDVQGVTAPVSSAKLRLYVTDESPVGGTIFAASNQFGTSVDPWTESGVTWTNAPVLSGGPLSTLGLASVDTWVEFDVTSGVTGNGLVSFAVTSSVTNSVYYSSKEGAHPPVLEIRTGSTAQVSQAELAGVRPVEMPTRVFEVRPARPNPFTGSTLIPYAIPRAGRVRLTVYSVQGQVVSRLLDRDEAAGTGHATWTGTDASGRRVAPGVYLYRFEYAGETRRGKLLLLD